jgi:hypothetical protein
MYCGIKNVERDSKTRIITQGGDKERMLTKPAKRTTFSHNNFKYYYGKKRTFNEVHISLNVKNPRIPLFEKCGDFQIIKGKVAKSTHNVISQSPTQRFFSHAYILGPEKRGQSVDFYSLILKSLFAVKNMSNKYNMYSIPYGSRSKSSASFPSSQSSIPSSQSSIPSPQSLMSFP